MRRTLRAVQAAREAERLCVRTQKRSMPTPRCGEIDPVTGDAPGARLKVRQIPCAAHMNGGSERTRMTKDSENLPQPAGGSPREQGHVLGPGVDAGFVPAPQIYPPAYPSRPTLIEELRPWAGPEPARPTFSPPVFGALSVIFGVTAFYKATLLLAPLALIAGLIACLKRQWGWGLIGALSALAALAIDPYFWGLAGIYYVARLLGLVG